MEAGMLGFFVLLLTAEVLGTIGGFGSSMLVMPLAGLFMPFDQALGLTALFHVFSNGAKMLLFRQGVSWRLLLWLGIPAVIAVIAGARLTMFMDERIMGLVLGSLLVVMGVGLLWKSAWRLRPTNSNALAGGVISGFIAGIAGTGGAVRGITLAAFDLEKMVFVSTSAWIDMGVDVSRSVVYASQGFINAHVLTYLPAMSVASITGSWLGKRALERISQSSFRSIVLGLVVLMGVITLWQAWSV
ncbi:MAG: sulfite exporter TauE/SafE family protein [Flavobacteriales bacterium]|nr:sulfite exporter TauE/SafE family protein [Flavobacteriales bacterium]